MPRHRVPLSRNAQHDVGLTRLVALRREPEIDPDVAHSPKPPDSEARASIGHYLDFYNARRPHSSLDGTTPDQANFNPLPLRLAA
jgi:transposase InsO family protein